MALRAISQHENSYEMLAIFLLSMGIWFNDRVQVTNKIPCPVINQLFKTEMPWIVEYQLIAIPYGE